MRDDSLFIKCDMIFLYIFEIDGFCGKIKKPENKRFFCLIRNNYI